MAQRSTVPFHLVAYPSRRESGGLGCPLACRPHPLHEQLSPQTGILSALEELSPSGLAHHCEIIPDEKVRSGSTARSVCVRDEIVAATKVWVVGREYVRLEVFGKRATTHVLLGAWLLWSARQRGVVLWLGRHLAVFPQL